MTHVLERVLGRLKGVRPSGDGYLALCPAHEDHRHSLSIADGNKGVVINCHAGCAIQAIVIALDIHLRDLFHETRSTSVECEYEYRDENGKLSYVVERRFSKRFRQGRPDGAGGWVWNIKGIEPLPYRLPELLAASPTNIVFIAEGEKDVDTLWSRGLVATCNSGGAGKWRDAHSRHLAGRRVVVLPDNDGPGQDHGLMVARSLAGIAAEVRTVDLPGLPAKGDVSDWFDAGHTTAELVKLSAVPVETISYDNEFVYASDYDEPEPQRWVVDGWIPEGFVTILFAPGGSSKSFLCQYMAMRIVLGMKIFDRDVVEGPVLFLDGELDRESWLRRGYMLARGMGMQRIPRGLVYRRVHPSLAERATRNDVLAFVRKERPVLVIIDSFTACLPGQDTNSLDDVAARMKGLDEFGTVLLIDHIAKNADAGNATAIGSVAKMNFARSALQIASSAAGGSVLKHSKSNLGLRTSSVAFALDIDSRTAVVRQLEAADGRLEGGESALPAHARIMAAFVAGEFPNGVTVGDLAASLRLPQKSVKNRLTALRGKGELVHDSAKKLWSLPTSKRILPFVQGGTDK